MSKYRNLLVFIDGVRFASKSEAARYQELRLLEKAGEIRDLELQPRYELQPPFTDRDGKRWRAIYYVSDFEYWEGEQGVAEEVKGFETAVWRMKRKMMIYRHPEIELRVVRA